MAILAKINYQSSGFWHTRRNRSSPHFGLGISPRTHDLTEPGKGNGIQYAHAFVHLHGASFNFLLVDRYGLIPFLLFFSPPSRPGSLCLPRRSFHSPLVFTSRSLEPCFFSFF